VALVVVELETVKELATVSVEMAMVEMATAKAVREMCSPPPLVSDNTSNQELQMGMLIRQDSNRFRHIRHHQMGTRQDPQHCTLNFRGAFEKLELQWQGKPTLLGHRRWSPSWSPHPCH